MAGTITALEAQKHSTERVNVYLEGEFAFGLAVIHAVNLRPGMWLSDEDIAALRTADEVERARERALDYLSYRPRSVAEVQRYLLERDFSASAVEDVLQGLQRVGLVDDVIFAQYWRDNREQFRPRGKPALVQELQQKGVQSADIQAALTDYDEVTAARRVAEEQGRRLKHLPPEVFKRRLIQRMARRGFAYDLIQEVLATVPFLQSNSEESEEL